MSFLRIEFHINQHHDLDQFQKVITITSFDFGAISAEKQISLSFRIASRILFGAWVVERFCGCTSHLSALPLPL
jgi:hypothetical protein